MNLYDIQNEYLELMRFLEENEGELTPELEEAMQFNKESFQEKALNYIKVINKLESEVAYAKGEIDRITSYINRKANTINMLESKLLEALKLYGEKDYNKAIYRYEVDTFRLSTRRSEVVEVDEESISAEWKQYNFEKLTLEEKKKVLEVLDREDIKIKETVSKTDIKKAIEGGTEIDGAKITEKFSLNIK